MKLLYLDNVLPPAYTLHHWLDVRLVPFLARVCVLLLTCHTLGHPTSLFKGNYTFGSFNGSHKKVISDVSFCITPNMELNTRIPFSPSKCCANEQDLCILWDSTCPGNFSDALYFLFGTENDDGLLQNLEFDPCYAPGGQFVDPPRTCSTSVPPASLAVYASVRNWARHDQCK